MVLQHTLRSEDGCRVWCLQTDEEGSARMRRGESREEKGGEESGGEKTTGSERK